MQEVKLRTVESVSKLALFIFAVLTHLALHSA